MIARAIGPKGYGEFAGLAGLATTLGALTGLGFGVLMLQDTSRDHTVFGACWKRALVLACVSGAFLMAIYLTIGPLVLDAGIGMLAYAAIGLPELVCFPLTIIASYAFQAHERMGWAGALYTFIPAGNILAVGAFQAFAPQRVLASYLPFHAVGSMLAAACATTLVYRLLSPKATAFSLGKRDVREGMGFSLMRLVETGMTSLDKTLVLKLGNSEIAGIYSSAYRLVSVLAVPATSLGMAVLPRLFRAYSDDRGQHGGLVRRMLVATCVYGLAAALAAWVLGDILPLLLGVQFSGAALATRWLAPLPLIYGLYTLGCNVLVTSHRRYLRVLAQLAGMVLLVATASFFVPRFGLDGAVATILVTQAASALLIWSLVRSGAPRVDARATP
ncbi:oligosaccharide flippase family protein [Frateuria edaphi]|nr:oligosaccharide flippase family protein [Frateuria edaphi]UGB46564.1 oligosaccharide flippase family protein [Frateuria edaphi]